MTQTRGSLNQLPLRSLFDALAVRRLRNSCRLFLTNNQQEIGFGAQVRWYFQHYRHNARSKTYRVFLFRDDRVGIIGYGALQFRDGRLFITECVAPQFRGQGYGKKILNSLIETGKIEKSVLVAEIWETNQASIALHIKAGFSLTSTREHNGQTLLVYHLEPES